jgi:hypothetical protein
MKRLLTQIVWIESCITLVFAVIGELRINLFKAREDGRDLAVIFVDSSQISLEFSSVLQILSSPPGRAVFPL